jgi:hypothetical protein
MGKWWVSIWITSRPSSRLAYIPAMIVGHLVWRDQTPRNLLGFLNDMDPGHIAIEIR